MNFLKRPKALTESDFPKVDFGSIPPLALEPRFMFDAAGAATGAEAAQDAAADAEAESAVQGDATGDSVTEETAAAGVSSGATDGRKEVLIVDPSVQDYQTLISGLPAGVEVVVLGENATVQDIANALNGMSNIDSLHILSHGATGEIILGGESLSSDNLETHTALLEAIGSVLAETGDILLYGCNVGSDGSGQDFLDALANATGADIAASDDLTGATELGGDWDLEVTKGTVESAIPFSASAQEGYVRVLSSSFDFENATGTTTVTQTVAGVTMTISTANNSSLVLMSASGVSGGDGIALVNHSDSTSGTWNVSFSSNVDITSLNFGSQTNGSFNWVLTPTGGSGTTKTIPQTTPLFGSIETQSGLDWTNISGFTIANDSGADTRVILDSIIFTVAASNTAPTLSSPGADAAFTEGGGAVTVDSGFTITDGQSDNITGGTVTISSNRETGDTLAVTDQLGITSSYNSSTGVLTLSGTASASSYQTVLRTLTFNNATNENPTSNTRTLTYSFTDSGSNSAGTTTQGVAVTSVNDAPTATSLTQTKAYTEDDSSVALDDIVVTDVDGTDTITATLTLSNSSAGSLTTGTFGSSTSSFSNGVWTVSGTVTDVNAALAAVSFTPSANWDQNITITTQIRDNSNAGPTNGSIALNVTPVNDNPTGTSMPASVSVTEDTLSNVNLSAATFADVDGDTITVTLTVTAGTFAAPADGASVGSGVTETLVNSKTITLSGSAADINTYLDASSRIRYTADANVNGSNVAQITATVNDGKGGGEIAAGSTQINVTAVNDAPTITDNATVTLSATNEDTTSSATTVSSILTSASLADVDSGASSGIAITGLTGNGTWQYSTDSGSNWYSVGTVSGNAALLLSSAAQLRYVPDSQNGETATATFRAWDQTSGSATSGATKQTGDTSTNGGSSAFSSQSASASISVSSINDAPTLTATGLNPTYTEGAAGTDLFSTVTASTVESADRFSAMTMTVTNVSDGASEVIRFDGADVALTNGNSVTTLTNGLSVSVSVSGSTATISFAGATLTNAQLQTLVDGLTYRNSSDNPTTSSNRVVTITGITDNGGSANGGSDSAALNLSSTVSLTAVNDAPVFTSLNGTPSFTEGGSAVVLDGDVTISDIELGSLNSGFNGASLVLVRNGGANASDVFSMVDGGTLTLNGSNIESGGNVIASFDTSVAGQLTITFQNNGVIPTTTLVNEVMQAIRYSNSSDAPASSVQIDWTFNDSNAGSVQGTGGAQTVTGVTTVSITGVNDAPTLSATGQNPSYVEGAGGSDLFSTVTASTVESADRFNAMTMTVTNVSDGASEIISFDGSDVALTNGNSVTSATNGLTVNVSVTGSTATISFTGATLTAAQMQTLVDGLSYRNTSENPTTAGNRVVTITGITDNGGTANSGSNSAAPNLTSTVSLTAVNDAPVIGNLNGDNTALQPGNTSNIDKDGNFSLSNADSTDYNGGSLVITPNGGNTASGNFTLDGTNATSGGDGTIAAGETIMVGGVSIGTVHATNDGQGGNTLTITLNANATDARIQTLVQNTRWSASAGSGAQSFDLVVNDADGTANGGAESASATFTMTLGNPAVVANLGGDSVNFAEGDSAIALDSGGNLTITDADNPANFNGGNLTVTVSGNAQASEDILTLITTGTVSLAGTTAGSNVSVGGTVIGTLGNNIAAGNNLVINFNSNATIARVQDLARAVAYQNDSQNPTASTRSVSMTLTDNDGLASTAAVSSVVVSAVNDNPSATGVPASITVTEDTASNVDLSAISISDVDAGSSNITVTIAASAGTLTASSGGGVTISGSTSGTLTLTGTVANIDTYLNTASNIQYTGATNAAGNSAATLTITANDGGNTGTGGGSNVTLGTVTVNINGVNDAPNIGNLSGDSVNYTAGQTIKLDVGQNALVTDVDSTNLDLGNGGTLTVSISAGLVAGEDLLTISTAGTTVSLAGTTAGSTVSVGGTVIGTLTNGIAAGNNLVISLNSNSTPANVQEVVRAVAYQNTAGTPTYANRTVSFTLSDGDATSSAITTTIVVAKPTTTTTPPPVTPPAPTPTPVVTPPPLLQTPGTTTGGDAGTPVSSAITTNAGGNGSSGPIIAGGNIQTTVTGQLGNTSPIGNSGTPVSAGLTSSQVGSGLGGGASIVGSSLGAGGAAGGGLAAVQGSGGLGSSVGGSLGGGLGGGQPAGGAGGFGGAPGAGAGAAGPAGGLTPGGGDGGGLGGTGLNGGPAEGLDGLPLGQPGGEPGADGQDGAPPAEGAPQGDGGDQAALEEGGDVLASAWQGDFSSQLAAFGGMTDQEARLLAKALTVHQMPV